MRFPTKRFRDEIVGKRYENVLAAQVLPGCESLLDVGCGANSPIKEFSKHIPRSVGVDGFLPSIETARKQGIHTEYRQSKLMEVDNLFSEREFDVVVGLDVIEHFEKPQGLALIQKLEKLARKRVVLFTPNGFVPQEPVDGNEYQRHLSGWTVEEMKALGYCVYGINGYKPWRGEFAGIIRRPKKLFLWLSRITERFVYQRPEKAFQILCVKDMGRE